MDIIIKTRSFTFHERLLGAVGEDHTHADDISALYLVRVPGAVGTCDHRTYHVNMR